MKRPLITNSDHHLMFTTGEEQDIHGRALQSVMEVGLEDDDYIGVAGEKKRRLGVEQVRALEKSFEVDNKLDPERKVKLALELGLQPRQVAVWFQNRRARWKGKQLEHDYAALKASYDSLRLEFNCLQRDKDSLISKIDKLKAKLAEDGRQGFVSLKHEDIFVETAGTIAAVSEELPCVTYKDTGSADSDSSAVLNDESSDLQFGSSADHDMLLPAAIDMGFGTGTVGGSMLNCKVEDYEFIGADEEPCSSFFADEQPPSLCGIDRWW